MSLLFTDITKGKRLSLKDVKLPEEELKKEIAITPTKERELPPTAEEIAYSNLVAINPLIAELVDRLNLVSSTTGKRIKKVNLQPEIDIKPQLLTLAERILEQSKSYSKEEILKRIKEATNVNQERAERGFTLLITAGAVEQIINQDLYYLGGSTPF
jgi:hypothetical protein